jgi:DNA-binding response OmpR family regulator
MRILVYDFVDRYDFEKVFVSDENDFYTKILEKKFDLLIINFNLLRDFLEIKKFFKGIVVFMSEYCDELIYKKSLEYGDYCFSYSEYWKLKYRLKYLKTRLSDQNSFVFKCGDLLFNMNTYQLYKNKIPQKITKAEAELLKILIKNKKRYVSKEEILEYSENIDSETSIKVIISKLRKLGFDIKSQRNLGYQIKE